MKKGNGNPSPLRANAHIYPKNPIKAPTRHKTLNPYKITYEALKRLKTPKTGAVGCANVYALDGYGGGYFDFFGNF